IPSRSIEGRAIRNTAGVVSCTGRGMLGPGPDARAGRGLRLMAKLRGTMTPAATAPTDPELEATAWDLEPLVDGEGEAGVTRRLEEALTLAKAFAERYAAKLAELDAASLSEAMQELAAI